MRFLPLRGGVTPSGAFTKTALDGSNNSSFQVGQGYLGFNAAVNYRESHQFPLHTTASLVPAGVFTKAVLDGTHNSSLQAGQGYWGPYALLNDYPIWYRTLTSILGLPGFFYSKFQNVFRLIVTGNLSFVAGPLPRVVRKIFTATSSFAGKFIRGRFFFGTLSFSVVHIPRHIFNRTLTAVLSFATEFRTHWHTLYRLYLTTASLSFSGFIPPRTFGKFFNAFAILNQSPFAISGLKFWLKSDSIPIVADGTFINSWPESSGNGFDMSAPTSAARPTYKTNFGFPTVHFTTNQFMKGAVDIGVSPPDTVIAVARQNDTATYGLFFTGTGSTRQQLTTTISTGVMAAYAGSFTAQDGVNHTGAFHIFCFSLAASQASNGYLDGAQVWTSQNIGPNSTSVPQIGGLDWSGPTWSNCDIAEILIYTHQLTSQELNIVNSYLGRKYGITITGSVDLGALTKQAQKIYSAVLSFVGTFSTFQLGHFLKSLTASLSFSGLIKNRTSHLMTAVLSFVGSFIGTIVHHYQSTQTAILSFVGSIQSQRGRIFTAALSFSGKTIRAISHKFTATLSFVGKYIRNVPLAAVLSFVGFLNATVPTPKLLTASLSFIGSLLQKRGRLLTATLSFAGVTTRFITHKFTAILSFVGTFIRARPRSFTAALSFIGSYSTQKGRVFTAVLSFSGSLQKAFARVFKAVVIPIGIFIPRGPIQFTKLLTGFLHPQGGISSRILPIRKVFTAALYVQGLLTSNWITHFHQLLLTTTLRFRTDLTRSLSSLRGRLQTFFLMVFNIDQQQAVTVTPYFAESGSIVVAEQTIGTTPVAIDMERVNGAVLSTLFIKNLSTANPVTIDSSASMNEFPQTIPPGLGIYLSPKFGNTVYAQANAGTVDIQVVAAL